MSSEDVFCPERHVQEDLVRPAAVREEVAWDSELSQEKLESRQAGRKLEELVGNEAAVNLPYQDARDKLNFKTLEVPNQRKVGDKLFGVKESRGERFATSLGGVVSKCRKHLDLLRDPPLRAPSTGASRARTAP